MGMIAWTNGGRSVRATDEIQSRKYSLVNAILNGRISLVGKPVHNQSSSWEEADRNHECCKTLYLWVTLARAFQKVTFPPSW